MGSGFFSFRAPSALLFSPSLLRRLSTLSRSLFRIHAPRARFFISFTYFVLKKVRKKTAAAEEATRQKQHQKGREEKKKTKGKTRKDKKESFFFFTRAESSGSASTETPS